MSFKELPQNATGVLEWSERLSLLRRWQSDPAKQNNPFGKSTFLLVDAGIELPFLRVYENKSFSVFQLISD